MAAEDVDLDRLEVEQGDEVVEGGHVELIMAAMTELARRTPLAAKGFMPVEEGDALHAAALAAAEAVPGAPFVEVGSYCGRSTIWLAAAAREAGTVVFAVDHHRGSEENQAGWEHHDPDVVDPTVGWMDTLPWFRRTLFDAGLERCADRRGR